MSDYYSAHNVQQITECLKDVFYCQVCILFDYAKKSLIQTISGPN